MKTIEIDLTGCKYLSEIHERIREAFNFSEDYGHNWDAFWDFLWSEYDADQVVIKGEESLSREFENDIKIFHEVLEDNVKFRQENGLPPFSYTKKYKEKK